MHTDLHYYKLFISSFLCEDGEGSGGQGLWEVAEVPLGVFSAEQRMLRSILQLLTGNGGQR